MRVRLYNLPHAELVEARRVIVHRALIRNDSLRPSTGSG
jgi:hypothetical protein